MKIISFFSRFTLICNLSFLLFVIFSKLEAKKPVTQGRDIVESIPFFKDLVITLGFSAIVINFLMCLTYGLVAVFGKRFLLPKWLSVINFVFLIAEFYYFFF